MNKLPVNIAALIASTLVVLAAGCSKAPVVEAVKVNSIAYYKANLDQAEQQVKQCSAMQEKELSVMTRAERENWNNSPMGINCKTATYAISIAKSDAYQKSIRDTNDKLGKDGYGK